MRDQLIAHWPAVVALLTPVLGALVATIVTLYGDPDHDPRTPPPLWVVPFAILQGFFTVRAGAGRKGLDGFGDGRWSVPGHFPQIGAPVPGRAKRPRGSSGKVPPPPPAVLLVGIMLGLASLTGCATWKEVARVSLLELERAHGEVSVAARDFNVKHQADFRARSEKVKTIPELEQLVAEHAKYELKYRTFVEVQNKVWACIAQARSLVPLLDQLTDPKRRAEFTGYITNGLAFLLQAKDTLSVFGVQIGGGGT